MDDQPVSQKAPGLRTYSLQIGKFPSGGKREAPKLEEAQKVTKCTRPHLTVGYQTGNNCWEGSPVS